MTITLNKQLADGTTTFNVLPSDFIPRVGDSIIYRDDRYVVHNVVVDYDLGEIRVWVKDHK